MANKENSLNNNRHTFYAVSLSSDVKREDLKEDIKLVFDNMKEASEVVKKFNGSRFKAFDNFEEAILFSQSMIISKEIDFSDKNQSNKNIEKILSPFSGLHPRELSKLRKAIENGNYSTVEQLIQTNPRYLVGSGDTPSILMEGPRYNSCHICAKANKPEILGLILNTISNKQFWKQLFPFDTNEITKSRINFSLDLYLNTPCSERALCDTPLHLASKWGSLETIAILLSYPKCDIEKTNKMSQKPFQVICERKGDKSLKKEIIKLFEAQIYIPLIRDDFSAQTLICRPVKGSVDSTDLNGGVSAVAGPMSPQQAEELYRTLKSPHKCTPNDRKIRLTDSRKGLERVCRNLCKDLDINFEEFWPFLNTRIDLTSDEGLRLLETHLQHIYYDLDRNSSKDGNAFTNEDKSSQLVNQMSKLDLNCSDISLEKSDEQNESYKQYIDCQQISNVEEYNDSSNDSFISAYSQPMFLYEFYVKGSNITREDFDAALALQHIINSNHCLEYDFIQDWFRRVYQKEPKHFDCFETSDTALRLTQNN